MFLCRFNESVEMLKEAHDIAEKLTEKYSPSKAIVYYKLALSFSFWRPDCQEAVTYAEEAIKMKNFLDTRDVRKIREIIERSEDYSVVIRAASADSNNDKNGIPNLWANPSKP